MKKHTTNLTLHQLIVDLSFWGTSVRMLLFAMVASVAFAFALSESATAIEVDRHIVQLIYTIGSFVLLDFGYVMVARAYPLVRWADIVTLLGLDIMVALMYVVPKVVVSQSFALREDPLVYVFFIAIGAIAARLLLGLLFSTSKTRSGK